MITLYGFGRVHDKVIGETRDLRAYWALEETGLPYRVHGVDHTGGEHLREAYGEKSCFNQIPAIDDNGFTLSESAAILLYLAEKSGKLIPQDFEGRARVTQWCFAAVATVEPPLAEIQMIHGFFGVEKHKERLEFLNPWAGRVLGGLEKRLIGREWIACTDFTVADILLTCVLREIRKTDLMKSYPRLANYYDRALARPAWTRALTSYAQLLGKNLADIR
ncbi:MAG: glutathione S-transferase family protein [Bdellovibrionota bacterium]